MDGLSGDVIFTAAAPPEAPLDMPTQPYRGWDGRRRATRWFQPGAWAARLYMLLATGALVGFGAREMHAVVDAGGVTVAEWAFLALFTLTFAWIAFAAVGALLGFCMVVLAPRPRLVRDADGLTTRSALLMPVYNEAPERVFSRVLAMAEDLDRHGADHHAFEFFVLSDTTDPALLIEEQIAFQRLRASLPASQRAWYRRRAVNHARKAGNVAEFVERWGGRYDHMLVFDADSLMEAPAILTLVAAMEREEGLAILQTAPQVIGGETLFARLQQFAGALYGPVFAAGLAAWHGRDRNYWGHNAILRTRAFAAEAGLPEMPGKTPFGGHPLSHDFLEAAYLRRAGWGVRMLPFLPGSYEEGPPSLIDAAVRDRRWCQGNLQHARFLLKPGFALTTRLHLLTGIFSYVSALVWALLVTAGMVLAVQAKLTPTDYFTGEYALFPSWPKLDTERAVTMFLVSMAVLLAPKALGLLAAMLRGWFGWRYGGPVALSASALVELVLSALYAPLQLAAQARAVAAYFAGKDSGWKPQRRDDGSASWREVVQRHRGDTMLAILAGGACWLLAPEVAPWLAPTLAGLLIAVPLSSLSGSRGLGRALRALGLLVTPSERRPPGLAQRAHALCAAWPRPEGPCGLRAVLKGGEAARAHRALADRRAPPLTPAAALAEAKLTRAADREVLLAWLTPQEEAALLADPALVERAQRLPVPLREMARVS